MTKFTKITSLSNARVPLLTNCGLVYIFSGILQGIMGLTVDDVMDKIGSFGRYQYRLLFIFGFMKIFGDGIQIMIPTFLSIEPAWRCKDNNSACNLTGLFRPGNDNYSYRCSIPRDAWEFDRSEIKSSVVTEVRSISLRIIS